MVIEIEPGENIAAGRFGWGLGPWVSAGSVRRVDVHPDARRSGGPDPGAVAEVPETAGGIPEAAEEIPEAAAGIPEAAAGILETAAGRSLVVVVRDAHRDPAVRSLLSTVLSARPNAVLVEMGLPLWQPPEGTSYLVTYGASRSSAQAAAELLGLVRRG